MSITGGVMMVLFLGGLILLIVWGVRAASTPRLATSDSALEVLKARLAAGTITHEEYEKTHRVLGGTK